MVSLLASTIVATLAVKYAASLSFSYKYLESEDVIEIDISTEVTGTGTSRYVAVAFALEPKMMDADGYYCTHQNLTTFSILDQHAQPFEYQSLGLASLVSANLTNGVLQCKFRRPVAALKVISGRRPFMFDLSKRSFSVLLAHGEVKEGKMSYHGDKNAKVLPQKLKITRPNAVTASTCNIDKNCVQDPYGCSPQDPECIFFSLSQVNDRISMELSGGFGNGRQYVGVAFSRHQEMKDADLYYCDGRRLTSGVIREAHQPPLALDDEFVNVTMAATINGVGQCRFSRDICVNKDVSKGTLEKFDFATDLYYVLYAHGNITRDGKITNHGHDGRGLSTIPLSLANGTNVQYQCVTIPSLQIPTDSPNVTVMSNSRSTNTVSATSKASSRRLNRSLVILAVLASILFL